MDVASYGISWAWALDIDQRTHRTDRRSFPPPRTHDGAWVVDISMVVVPFLHDVVFWEHELP